MNRHIISLIPALGIPAAITAMYHLSMNFSLLILWVVSVNLMLLALLGKDKFAAKRKASRTPEFTLLALTFAGGTPAMLIGQKIFSHKTSKKEFIYALIGTIAAQMACIYLFRSPLLALL